MDTIHTIGRRKASIARIYMSAGKGNIIINKKASNEYFSTDTLLYKISVVTFLKQAIIIYVFLKNTLPRISHALNKQHAI